MNKLNRSARVTLNLTLLPAMITLKLSSSRQPVTIHWMSGVLLSALSTHNFTLSMSVGNWMVKLGEDRVRARTVHARIRTPVHGVARCPGEICNIKVVTSVCWSVSTIGQWISPWHWTQRYWQMSSVYTIHQPTQLIELTYSIHRHTFIHTWPANKQY